MRKFKAILFSVLCVAIVFVIGVEVYAAVYLTVKITGTITYEAKTIGARIYGTKAYNEDGADGTPYYLEFSGSGTFENYVYYVSGTEDSYTSIIANVGETTFNDYDDSVEFWVFLTNVGERYILPTVKVGFSDESALEATTEVYYFDISKGATDPLSTQGSYNSSSDASSFISKIETAIANGETTSFGSNSSIDNNDTYAVHVTISIPSTYNITTAMTSTFEITISFMADIQYTSNNILSVYQTQNQTNTSWTKYGVNAEYEATPTQISTSSLSVLETYLDSVDANGNVSLALSDVYSESAVVYKDIDIVNVDIATGEIIGKLSDLDYNFEWYGRQITLTAGTTLASGRTLTEDESFTVDVYTYYPDMYVRRWVVGDVQWISISDTYFTGSVLVEAHYTATFESTIFNYDLTVAKNSYGVIARSYVYDLTPTTSGSASYLISNYGYNDGTTDSAATVSTTQSNMLSWASNLTKAWEDASDSLDGYTTAVSAQGENWTAYVYNLLYLVKYADNNSQSQVGNGNTYTNSVYYASGVTVTTTTGATVTTGTGSDNSYSRYESEKGGGTIGVYSSANIGTATYSQDAEGNYYLSSSGYDAAGMNYGYNSTYYYGSDKQGLYSNQFLTYNTGTKRVLLDGYVGTDGYTSVFCLGLCNSWGNVWTWVFGNVVSGTATTVDETTTYTIQLYTTFDDYDYSTGNWYVSSTYANASTLASGNYNYVQMSYNLPQSNGYYRYVGTSSVSTTSGYEMLVGLPTADSSTASAATGLCDYYYVTTASSYTTASYGVLRGGSTAHTATAGVFYFSVINTLTNTYTDLGLRLSLTS